MITSGINQKFTSQKCIENRLGSLRNHGPLRWRVAVLRRHNRWRIVIFLDWSGVDLSLNPLHPASKLFDSKSSLELQYIYILKIERLSIGIVL